MSDKSFPTATQEPVAPPSNLPRPSPNALTPLSQRPQPPLQQLGPRKLGPSLSASRLPLPPPLIPPIVRQPAPPPGPEPEPAARPPASVLPTEHPPAPASAPAPLATVVPSDARQPASIDGLVSPAAAAPAAPGAPKPPPLRDHPDAPAGANQPEQQQAPLPGAVPGTPAGARPQASAVSARMGSRTPPSGPPPISALQEAAVAGDGRSVEEYIPFGFVELRGKLLADHRAVFADAEVQKKFLELCKWMSLRNSLRLEIDYGDAHEKYALLDPDKDTLAFRAAAADGTNGSPAATPMKDLIPKVSITAMVRALEGEMDDILERAEFSELPKEDLEKAKNDKSLMGVDVISASDEFLEYRLHYRGTRSKKIEWRRWGLFKRQIQMHVYERLAISFRLKKPVCDKDAPADDNIVAGVDTRPWYKKVFCGSKASVSPSLLELRDEYVYMKLFKDVLQCDVDMLLPGAVIKFTWFDYLMIWVPILFGVGMAIWKAVSGTIDFSNLMNALLSVVLIVMPITWGVRAYMAVKEKERLHQAHLNAIFLTHNLNNNAGVISQLLDEAQEQEDNETMLAYFFLWAGEASPKQMRKIELDRAVETYLQRTLDDLGVAIRMDYEVVDSIVKLERLGLLRVTRGADLETRLQALPLEEALEKAHVRHFDETRETAQPEVPRAKSKRQGSVSLAWYECVNIFRPTGQKFRYFWNANTGESQYHEPDEPFVKLGTGLAVDFEDAHGEDLVDPAKHTPIKHGKTT